MAMLLVVASKDLTMSGDLQEAIDYLARNQHKYLVFYRHRPTVVKPHHPQFQDLETSDGKDINATEEGFELNDGVVQAIEKAYVRIMLDRIWLFSVL